MLLIGSLKLVPRVVLFWRYVSHLYLYTRDSPGFNGNGQNGQNG